MPEPRHGGAAGPSERLFELGVRAPPDRSRPPRRFAVTHLKADRRCVAERHGHHRASGRVVEFLRFGAGHSFRGRLDADGGHGKGRFPTVN